MYIVTAIRNAYADGERPVSVVVLGVYTSEAIAKAVYEKSEKKYWLCKVELTYLPENEGVAHENID